MRCVNNAVRTVATSGITQRTSRCAALSTLTRPQELTIDLGPDVFATHSKSVDLRLSVLVLVFDIASFLPFFHVAMNRFREACHFSYH